MMTLIDGRFYVDGKEVPIQIGNKEQIKLLKDRQKLMDEGAKIDITTDEFVTYTFVATFECPSCGKKNHIDDDSEYPFNNSDIKDDFIIITKNHNFDINNVSEQWKNKFVFYSKYFLYFHKINCFI
jgi:hypothetical protein